jgi:porin
MKQVSVSRSRLRSQMFGWTASAAVLIGASQARADQTPAAASPPAAATPAATTAAKPGATAAAKPAPTPSSSSGLVEQKVDGTATPAVTGDADFKEENVGDAVSATPAAGGAAPAAGATAPAAGAAAAAETPTSVAGPFGFLSNIQRSSQALGDMWGLRTALAKYGATLTIQEQSEVIGNATGGTGREVAYEGLTTATLQVDTQRAFGLYGGLFNVSGLQIHGQNLTADTLQSLQAASGIEGERATRLWELWYQQKFFDDKVDIKIGQQSIDQEFMVSQNAGLFVNTMMGWPMLPSADMPGGGPAYPLSALGIRGRIHITDNLTLLAGLYSGWPNPGQWAADSQTANCCGTSFTMGPGVLAIAELQWAYPGPNTIVQAGEPDPLSRTYKVGVWYNSASFQDQRYDTNGIPLASPDSNGQPAMHDGDYSFYAVADQMVYRFADDPDRNINVFVRPMFTPLQDRNLLDFSINAGITMHEPIYGRDDDTFGIGIDYTHVTAGAAGADQDVANYNPGVYSPVRSYETLIEATYQYEATPWLVIQPTAQYTFNPGAGLANPNEPGTKIQNEAVFGVRVNIQL